MEECEMIDWFVFSVTILVMACILVIGVVCLVSLLRQKEREKK
jgi:hypothetical protein